jgi:hypothetical protein
MHPSPNAKGYRFLLGKHRLRSRDHPLTKMQCLFCLFVFEALLHFSGYLLDWDPGVYLPLLAGIAGRNALSAPALTETAIRL